MATKIETGGGYQAGYDDGNAAGYSSGYSAGYQAAEVFDGYTLFKCLIGSKWGAKNGDLDANNRRCILAHIDMTRVKSLNITLLRTNGYDYIKVTADSDGSQIFYHQGPTNLDIDLSAVAYDKKKQVTFEWYSADTGYLQINSVTKAE